MELGRTIWYQLQGYFLFLMLRVSYRPLNITYWNHRVLLQGLELNRNKQTLPGPEKCKRKDSPVLHLIALIDILKNCWKYGPAAPFSFPKLQQLHAASNTRTSPVAPTNSHSGSYEHHPVCFTSASRLPRAEESRHGWDSAHVPNAYIQIPDKHEDTAWSNTIFILLSILQIPFILT